MRMPWVTGNRRRLLRGFALIVAGALLGSGIVAWSTGTLPFVSEPCWNSLPAEDVDDLFDGQDTESSGIPPAFGHGELLGHCRVMVSEENPRGLSADIRVRKLYGTDQDNLPWAREFLSTRLTPLGKGLLGMASDSRAWVALPDACTGKPGDFDGPGVVDVALGEEESSFSPDADADARYQKALARTAVHVANGAMEELGCRGALALPGELTPAPQKFRPMAGDRQMCDLKGVTLPKSYVGSGARMRSSVSGPGTTSPVHGCDIVTGMESRPEVRLRTVQEPDLVGAFPRTVLDLGEGIGNKGGPVEAAGSFSPTTAAVRAECPEGPVMFLAEDQHRAGGHTFLRKVFPSYVATEAERLGCGRLDIRMGR